MFARLKRLWDLSKYEVVHANYEEYGDSRPWVNSEPRLRNAEAKPKGMAKIISLENTVERDFPEQE